jgi:hypothetical protein
MPRTVLALLAAAFLAASARAQPFALHVGGGAVKLTPDQCARKAVEAMGVKEKFHYAAVGDDGHAFGWNDAATVVVLVQPQALDGHTAVFIFAARRDNKEAERLNHAVRVHIFEGPTNPDAPDEVCSAEAKTSRAPWFSWRVEERPAVSTAKYFKPVASLALEKRGYRHANPFGEMVLGTDGVRVAGAFVHPGASALKLAHATVTFGDDEDECDRLASSLLSGVLKALYD